MTISSTIKIAFRKAVACACESAPVLLCSDLKPVTVEHENPWFKVLSRGGFYTFEPHRPQVAVLPIVDDKNVLMLRVKRPVIGDCPLELPAGDSMVGESPIDAVVREFAEETGITIEDRSRFKPELMISEMPGRIPRLLSIFSIYLSKGEFERRRKCDEEIYSVNLIPISELPDKIISGEIYLSCTCAILSRLVLERVIKKYGILEV